MLLYTQVNMFPVRKFDMLVLVNYILCLFCQSRRTRNQYKKPPINGARKELGDVKVLWKDEAWYMCGGTGRFAKAVQIQTDVRE